MLLNFPVTHHSSLLACEEGEILFDSLFISVFFLLFPWDRYDQECLPISAERIAVDINY